jgi:hypothetical protein
VITEASFVRLALQRRIPKSVLIGAGWKSGSNQDLDGYSCASAGTFLYVPARISQRKISQN